MPSISIRRLYQDNQKKLQLSLIAGSSNLDDKINVDTAKSNWSYVGHFNFVHPNKIQVIGVSEYEFLKNKLSQDRFGFFLDFIVELEINLIIIANDLPIIPELKEFCVAHSVLLMHSKIESPKLLDVLQIYLQKALAISTTLHGVFLNIFEMGVLFTGHSGLGKSELALELISRGHSLIADDAVKIYRIGPETLEGRCPKILRDFLEVRGLGILNIRSMFGETSVRIKKELKLIINLVGVDDDYMKNLDRLSVRTETETVLDVSIKKTTIPVAAGRNIAVLAEAAVRNHILHLRGMDSLQEFLSRHNKAMSTNEDNLLDEDQLDY